MMYCPQIFQKSFSDNKRPPQSTFLVNRRLQTATSLPAELCWMCFPVNFAKVSITCAEMNDPASISLFKVNERNTRTMSL